MKIAASLAASLVAAAALTGCSTIDKLDAKIAANIDQFCLGASQAQTLYLAASPVVPEAQRARVDRAWATVERLCANPASVNTATLTAAVASHLAALNAAKNAAKAAETKKEV